MLSLLLLCAAALASAAAQDAQQSTAPLPHLSDPLAEGGLNPMHIPAVRGSYVAGLAAHGVDVGARHRRMQAHPETGAMPHLHDMFDFIGITDAGFVDFKYNAVVANTTINTDDYVCHEAHRPRAATRRVRAAQRPRCTALCSTMSRRSTPHHAAPHCTMPRCAVSIFAAPRRSAPRHATPS
jgi:hypothetical protein